MAFPASVERFMPRVPPGFKNSASYATWAAFQRHWFFKGIAGLVIEPKKNIDLYLAMRHIACIQRSYAPKHEEKVLAVAYLASLWFESWGAEKDTP